MVKEIKLSAKSRTSSGTAEARRMRKSGWLPAVIGNEKGKSLHIQLNGVDFLNLMRHRTSENLIIDLDVEGVGTRKVIMREVQRHPVRDTIHHVDFVEISMTRKMRVTIPVVFIGEPVGVTQGGGILEHVLRELDVECLPGDLVDSLPVDVSSLALGHSLLVRDVKVPSTLTVLTPSGMAVAIVSIPRKEEEVAPTEEAAATEPELIKKKKEEGEGGTEGATDEKGKAASKEKEPAASKEKEAKPKK